MIVAGIMSGTSADGIDVALVRMFGRGLRTRMELLAHKGFAYPAPVRRAVLAAMNAPSISVAEVARLNFLLAELYADAVAATEKHARTKCELAGCHGQTIFHQGTPAPYLGRKLAVTWQIGEGSVLAAQLGRPVVCDFRPADMAAGGLGAPLVPYLDFLLYRHSRRGRIVQNIGGIGNLTAIPPAAKPGQVRAFDTGPGNMVIDALASHLFGKRFDRDGEFAARGNVIEPVVAELLRAPYFRRKGPKTAGREQFGGEYARRLLALCRRASKYDVLATATALTARSIAIAARQVMAQHKYRDFFVSGGGTRNATLMRMLAEELAPTGLVPETTDAHGLPSEAKEAAAFALLAYQTWHRTPSNIPSATGASGPAILGKICYA
jgi:anhydro-N-acetylmuramic acid kinase